MDTGVLALLIPVLAIATGLVAVLRMPKEAFLPKPKRGERVDAGRLEELEYQVQELREQLAETQERLDFAERAMLGRPQRRPVEPAPEQTPPFITPVR